MWSNILKPEDVFERMKISRFREKFFLTEAEQAYARKRGDMLRKDILDIINSRLVIKYPNDGRQTPYKGNPIFKAQHATATCCRKCLENWHKIPQKKRLNYEEIKFVANVIEGWIERQLTKTSNSELIRRTTQGKGLQKSVLEYN